MDTAIFWEDSDGFEWANAGAQGCSGGPGSSSVQPSAEEKKKFARAVRIVNELLKKVKRV